MFRFSIRDVFWFILLLALLLAWWREGVNLDSEKRTLQNDIRTAISARDGAQRTLRSSNPYYVAEGWHTLADPDDYEIGLDAGIRHGGDYSAFIKTISASPKFPASLSQSIRADEYRGKRIRLSAHLKTDNAARGSLAVGAQRRSNHSFNSYCDQSFRGTADWKRYELVLDIPHDSGLIILGVVAQGGTAWLDDLQLEVVGPDIPLTLLSHHLEPLTQPSVPKNLRHPTTPLSLDFEPPAAEGKPLSAAVDQ